jgi:ADP-ribosyl-[dinitrogen reductase] hydrolase
MLTPLTNTHHSRVLGSYYGALVGNALGAPYEFKARDSYIVDSEYVSSTRSGVSMPPGAWTDDSSMMLCLLESLLESGCKWDVDDCVRRWIRWMSEGYMTVVDESLDMGANTPYMIRLASHLSSQAWRP